MMFDREALYIDKTANNNVIGKKVFVQSTTIIIFDNRIISTIQIYSHTAPHHIAPYYSHYVIFLSYFTIGMLRIYVQMLTTSAVAAAVKWSCKKTNKFYFDVASIQERPFSYPTTTMLNHNAKGHSVKSSVNFNKNVVPSEEARRKKSKTKC